jgi:hypothetical protein
MTTTIRLPRDTLKEILDSIDELVRFTEGSSIDLNIATVDGNILIYVRPPSLAMVHELVPNDDVEVAIEGEGERICLDPNDLIKVVTKVEEGILEIDFLAHDYVVRYEQEEIFSEPLTLRLKKFVDSEFEHPPNFSELDQIGTLERASLYRALNVMSTVSPVVKVTVDGDMLSLQVKDKISGEGEVSPKLTDSEIEHLEAWYSIEPMIEFLHKTTSGDEVDLFVTPDNTLLLEVASENKISRLYIAHRVGEPR